MSRRWTAAAHGVLVTAALLVAPVVVLAAPEPIPATLTGLSFDGTRATGVVTVRASGNQVTIDPASVTATIGGSSYAVTVTPAATQRRAAVLVVDTSGSMGKAGMKTVREAVAAYLSSVPPDVEVGLVSFAATAGVDVAPTRDRAAVQAAADRLTSVGDTALYDGVDVGLSTLGTTGDLSLVLLSDGEDRRSSTTAARVAERIKSVGARTDVIGFNFASKASADQVLQGIAQAGGGTVAAVNDSAAVSAIFAAAARAIDAQAAVAIAASDVSGSREVVISGVAGGSPFRASATVDFGTARPVASAPTTATEAPTQAPTPSVLAAARPSSAAGTPWWLFVALAAIFMGILGGAGALLLPTLQTQRSQRVEAIASYLGSTRTQARREARSEVSDSMAQSLVQLGDRVMQGRTSTSATMALIQRADLPWRPGEWAVLRVVSVIVGVASGMLLLRDGLLGVLGFVLGAALGIVVPPLVLRFLARRRARMFERQMPDVLMLVASSLSTGFSLLQAMDAVAHDVSDPAAKEFARVMAETRIGSDVESALGRMAIRMNSENMRWAAMAIGIQRQVGGNLAETLRTTASTLREREVLRRHVRALSAEGRLSAVILVALPILLFVYEANVNRDYISLLWSTLIGWILVVVGILLMVVGVYWLTKVVKVEV